jgi:molecular chaperone IbpA
MEDYPMRTYDLTPFYRSTVGFDRFFSLLDQATADGSPGYPPYNIERTGENTYRISVAVSGFSQGELSIVAKENTLTIKGEKSANENGKDKSEVLYRGIAARTFERAFQLADFVVVKNASLENGLLHVDLVREIPAAFRSRPRAQPLRRSSTARPPKPPRKRGSGFGRHLHPTIAKTPLETGAFFVRRVYCCRFRERGTTRGYAAPRSSSCFFQFARIAGITEP